VSASIDSFATGPMWAGFIVFVLGMLALDLFVFGGRKAHRVSVKEALAWVIAWVCLALAFAGLLWWYLNGTQGAEVAQRKTLEFLAGYLIEQSLSVDNMFVFVMIFTYFAVPPELQRRVLLYGVLGAIVMRAGMILAGVWLVSEFAWVLYVFGAFLVITGVKMLIFAEHEPDLEKNPLLRWLRGHLRITPSFHGESFFVRQNGILWATPMFLVLILIEASDVVFAVDSIPAIFAVTTDPFIVFTSNIFAIMGCARCTSCLPTWRTASTCSSMGWPSCWSSSAARCWRAVVPHADPVVAGDCRHTILISVVASLALSKPRAVATGEAA
jgi:tellurite resistance protein TerC